MPLETKITRFLDAHNIPYRLLPHAEPVFTIEAAASQRGVVREEMLKSILLREQKSTRYVMACIKGDDRLAPQAVRACLPGAWRRLTFATREEIRAVTGYVQGAVAPLCLPADVPVVFDQSILMTTKVNLSSGDPLAGIEMATADLLRLTGGVIGSIAGPG